MKIKTFLSIAIASTLLLSGLGIFPKTQAPTIIKPVSLQASIFATSQKEQNQKNIIKKNQRNGEESLLLNLLETTVDKEHNLKKGIEILENSKNTKNVDKSIIELYRAKIMSRSLNFEKALELLERLDKDKLPILKATVLIAKNDRDTSEKYLQSLIEDYSDPYIVSVALSLINIYKTFDSYRDADISYLWTLFAQKFGDIGETEISLYLSKKSLETAPNYRDAWLIKGYNEYKLKSYKEAEKSLLMAYQLDPGNAKIQYLLGITYVALKQTDLSSKYLLYAQKNKSQYTEEIFTQLGENALREKNFLLASHYFKKSLEVDPKNKKAITQMIWISVEKLNQIKQGVSYTEMLNKFYPKDVETATMKLWIDSKIASEEE